jgi:hypothetical protein
MGNSWASLEEPTSEEALPQPIRLALAAGPVASLRLIPEGPTKPLLGPLSAATLLSLSAGAIAQLSLRELSAQRWLDGFLGFSVAALTTLAALAFSRRAFRAMAERITGGRKRRRGLLFGLIAGEPYLVVRPTEGPLRVFSRTRIHTVRTDPSGAGLILGVGPNPFDAGPVRLAGPFLGGASVAAAQLEAWLIETAPPDHA